MAVLGRSRSGAPPPDQILDPPLEHVVPQCCLLYSHVIYDTFSPQYELKCNILVFLIMIPSPKFVLAIGATIRDNTVVLCTSLAMLNLNSKVTFEFCPIESVGLFLAKFGKFGITKVCWCVKVCFLMDKYVIKTQSIF